jgi:hypothetical protein
LKTSGLIFSFLTLIALNAAALAETATDPIEQAVFASDPRITMPQSVGTRTVGVVALNLGGWGVAYSQVLQQDRNAWVQANTSPKEYLIVDHSEEIPNYGFAQLFETSRVQIMAGVDETFHATNNKYWGFILGASLGVNQSKYEETYYPKLCTWYCGFDPKNPTTKNSTDTYAFLGGRMGVAIRETKIMGVKGDLVIALNPILTRVGDWHKFRTPEGTVLPVMETTKLTIEALIEI